MGVTVKSGDLWSSAMSILAWHAKRNSIREQKAQTGQTIFKRRLRPKGKAIKQAGNRAKISRKLDMKIAFIWSRMPIGDHCTYKIGILARKGPIFLFYFSPI